MTKQEKSLVVRNGNKKLKKEQNALARAKVSGFQTGYGAYKTHHKDKKRKKGETQRQYLRQYA